MLASCYQNPAANTARQLLVARWWTSLNPSAVKWSFKREDLNPGAASALTQSPLLLVKVLFLRWAKTENPPEKLHSKGQPCHHQSSSTLIMEYQMQHARVTQCVQGGWGELSAVDKSRTPWPYLDKHYFWRTHTHTHIQNDNLGKNVPTCFFLFPSSPHTYSLDLALTAPAGSVFPFNSTCIEKEEFGATGQNITDINWSLSITVQ